MRRVFSKWLVFSCVFLFGDLASGLAQVLPLPGDSMSNQALDEWLRESKQNSGAQIGEMKTESSLVSASDSMLSDWEKEWMRLGQYNDAEKNFRLPAFMDFLSALAVSPWTQEGQEALPMDWVSSFSPDNGLWVAAAVLRYQNDYDRLLWVVGDQENQGAFLTFNKVLNVKSSHAPALGLRLSTTGPEDDLLLFQVLSGEQVILDLPDLSLRLHTARLVASDNDSDRMENNQLLLERMERLLEREDLFAHSFSDYEQLSVLSSPGGQLKVVSWNLEGDDFYNRFYGFVALRHKDRIRVYPLNDQYQNINNVEMATLNPNRWYGAVYYELLENRHRGSLFYTLLGYNAHGPFSKIRVVETLEVTASGLPRFGVPILEVDGRLRRRLIFEYSQRASMMLRFDPQKELIVMDNLAPSEQYLQGDFRYYGPDFTHNALRFDKGKWIFIPEVDIRNSAPQRQRSN